MIRQTASMIALTVVLCAPAAAETFSPAMTKAIQGFKLDTAGANAIIKTQGELSQHVMKNPEAMKSLATTMKAPLEERIALLGKDPAQSAVLKANGLGARDYSVGLIALRAAAWAVQGRSGPLTGLASPANIGFLKANPAILARFNEGEMGGGLLTKPR
ncbi:MAG: hypothetical protein HZB55_23440 [Deltaproteobacteria bacterium]|nr:hypothetical protein [Deltaproteobacteria bacterium]